MANSYLVVSANEYETLDTIILKVVSNKVFMRSWALLAQTLGFQISPGSQLSDLHVTNSGDKYIIHHLPKPVPSNAKIVVSDVKFEFIPETIHLGEPKSTQSTPDFSTSLKLINNDNTPKKFTRKLSTISSSSTTVSSSHKIATSFSIKQSYSAGVPGFFSASLGLNFNFSYDYTFGNQQKKQESTESIDAVSLIMQPKTIIPLTLVTYRTKLTVPFTALAQMSYTVDFEGPFNRSGSPHKDLGTPISNVPEIIKYSYKFGDDSKSAEESLMEEDNNKFIPGITPWDWNYIDTVARRLDLNFKNSIENGFATQISGKFEKDDSKIVSIQTNRPI